MSEVSRKTILILIGIGLLAGCAGQTGNTRGHAAPVQLLGAWELVSPPLDPSLREIKLITETHFIWVTYDVENSFPVSSGGGRCVASGNSYSEHLAFASGSAAALMGTVQSFYVRISSDTLYQSGTLTTGQELHEVWHRIR